MCISYRYITLLGTIELFYNLKFEYKNQHKYNENQI